MKRSETEAYMRADLFDIPFYLRVLYLIAGTGALGAPVLGDKLDLLCPRVSTRPQLPDICC